MFEREDWHLFRNLETLGQKAGVPTKKIPHVVVKELVDNALDAGCKCTYGFDEDGTIWVEDDGPGIPGTAQDIADLFSIGRPLRSSKLLRLPTRGALGNGLRVVVGAVLATGGTLTVTTTGRRLHLEPQDDGTTRILSSQPAEMTGTRIELRLGEPLKVSDSIFRWAKVADLLSDLGSWYEGRTSAYWYSSESFFDLLQAAGTESVVRVVDHFDRHRRIGATQMAAAFVDRGAISLSRDEADQLLGQIREHSKSVRPKLLGKIGKFNAFGAGHSIVVGKYKQEAVNGRHGAEIPFVVEVWADVTTKATCCVCVNRTPVTADIDCAYGVDKTYEYVSGCGSQLWINAGKRPMSFYVNVECPYLPITTDGKAPDFTLIKSQLLEALDTATRRAKRNRSGHAAMVTQKSAIVEHLDAAIEHASGGGRYRYSLRQLFYSIRPPVEQMTGRQLKYDHFQNIITEIERKRGEDLPRVYRDTRGVIYHPHLHQHIPVGTLMVEGYQRPDWLFNKILYIEKEGLFELLIDAGWPERHDCALLTGKGHASRAIKDLIDYLSRTGQPCRVFCLHDADASGTMIFQTLTEATAARGARLVEVINIGLDPWEAVEMGLEIENVDRKHRREQPIAEYVRQRRDGDDWVDWLQDHRIELNAMTSPQLIAFLDTKMAQQGQGKLVPPDKVLRHELGSVLRRSLQENFQEEILRKAGFDEVVEDAITSLDPVFKKHAKGIADRVARKLTADPIQMWKKPIGDLVDRILREAEELGLLNVVAVEGLGNE